MTNNTFNYKYSTLKKLLSALDNLMPRKEKLEKNGLKVEIDIKKSMYDYWNLKLKIYNEKAGNTKTRTFTEEVIINGES